MFSEKGGDYQERIHHKLVDQIKAENATLLDIGAESGSLSAKVAKRYSHFTVKAIDYWGDDWEYSKSQCIYNEQVEQVREKIDFMKASTSDMPFEDENFDLFMDVL